MDPARAVFELARRAKEREDPFCPHKPHPKQAEFLALDCREALYGGAAGGGKSDALLMAALQYAHVPGYSAILFRRTFTDLALPDAIMARSHAWLAGSKAHWNGDTKSWRFPSGATLTFGYLENARDHFRYQGAAFQFVGFDELTQFEEGQYRYLFSRLRRLHGATVPIRMRGATNPGGIGHEWVEERFIREPGDRKFVAAFLEDNPSLDATEYDAALRELDPITYEQLRKGRWVRDTSGLVYKYDKRRNWALRLPELHPGDHWRRVLGLDFGIVDECAYVDWAFSQHNPGVYCVGSGKYKGLAPSQFGKVVLELEQEHHYDRIVGDIGGMGKGFEAEWKLRFAIPMQAAQKTNKLGYIRLFNGDLANGLVHLMPGCEDYAEEMKALAWADEKRKKEHPALPNHLCDAGLYGWREAKHWAFEEYVPPVIEDELERREVEEFAARDERRREMLGL